MSKKSERDKAIDQALLMVGRQSPRKKGETILVRREDLGAPVLARAPQSAVRPKAQADRQSDSSAAAKSAKPKKAKRDRQFKAAPKSVQGHGRSRTNPPPKSSAPHSGQDRSARMQERKQEAAQFIAAIHLTGNDELLDMWTRNAVRMGDPNNNFRDLAACYVAAIEAEWRRRTMLAELDPDHFNWPVIRTTSGNGDVGIYDYAEGILTVLGYHVGKSGEQSASRRQALLARIFEGQLPLINGPDYMKGWGGPGTPVRLKKMADSIASLASSARSRSHADYTKAVEHWREDLGFLHRRYYVGRFAFGWPRGGSR